MRVAKESLQLVRGLLQLTRATGARPFTTSPACAAVRTMRHAPASTPSSKMLPVELPRTLGPSDRVSELCSLRAARQPSQLMTPPPSPTTGAPAPARSAATWRRCCTASMTCASNRRRLCRTGAAERTCGRWLQKMQWLRTLALLSKCQSIDKWRRPDRGLLWTNSAGLDTPHAVCRPAPGTARIAIKAVGICRSDVYYLERVPHAIPATSLHLRHFTCK